MDDHKIPPHIVSAIAIDRKTGKQEPLTTRPGSYCHFFEKFPADGFNIQLRLDWKDVGESGDPTLDADFFHPGDDKPIEKMRGIAAHHTRKDLNHGRFQYKFEYGSVRLQIEVRLGIVRTATAGACMETPQDP